MHMTIFFSENTKCQSKYAFQLRFDYEIRSDANNYYYYYYYFLPIITYILMNP